MSTVRLAESNDAYVKVSTTPTQLWNIIYIAMM